MHTHHCIAASRYMLLELTLRGCLRHVVLVAPPAAAHTHKWHTHKYHTDQHQQGDSHTNCNPNYACIVKVTV